MYFNVNNFWYYVKRRPNEHRIIHVLHWIKAAFKKQALDKFTEDECLNKEAYRYAFIFLIVYAAY